MKTKHALYIFVSGFLLAFPGALMKLMHWPYATEVLWVAMIIKAVGLVLLTYKIVRNPKVKDFFNS